MGSFKEARLAEVLPTVVAGPDGEALARVFGQAEDDDQALLTDGILARFAHRAPDDALDEVGRVYLRPRAPTPEANDPDAYRTRLAEQAWPHWETAPLKTGGMVTLFSPYGEGFEPTCFSNGDAVFDGNLAWFSRVFWIWEGVLGGDGAWDDGTPLWDDGGLWDIYYDASTPEGFGVPDLDYVRRDVRRSKSGQAYPVWIGVGLTIAGDGGPFWDSPGGLWDDPDAPDWDTFAVDGDFTFLPLGHVWEEEELFYGGGPGTWDGDPDDVWDDFYPPSGGW